MTIGLRVSPEEELEGLDFSEHGGNAYPDFEVSHAGGIGFAPSVLATSEAIVGKRVRKPVEQM